jgi:D-3-phosphoglycerate dehydrogenase / 2-oxoglutarate reductase
MKTVLLSAPYMIPFLERFRPIFERYQIELIIARVAERLEEDQLLEYAGQVDGVVCGDDRFSARVLRAFTPRLKVISKWGTGIDSIDREEAACLHIQVRNTPNAFTLPVADSTYGYMLAFARQGPWLDRSMKQGRWYKIPGRSLSECSLGVIGVGNIGKEVLRRGRAFGMTLFGNDIIPVDPNFCQEHRVEMVNLESLLRQSDFVSLHCDLNPTSYHLINEKTLGLMKPEGVLINTSRGPVVDEKALTLALQSGQIGGAALDVYEVEPLPLDSPLRTMDQVMLAPHNANSSPVAWERIHRNTILNLLVGLEIPTDDFDKCYQET